MSRSDKKSSIIRVSILLLAFVLFLGLGQAWAMEDEDCLGCHTDPDLTAEKDGKTISLTVDEDVYLSTVHAENGCISCHEDADVEDEHPYPMTPVNCGNCHDGEAEIYAASLHGVAAENDDPYAPTCSSCHGKHNIFPRENKDSMTYVLNIPVTCGTCHREGSAMTQTHEISKHNVLENYTMSIHGEGLYRKGLLVTAVCSSCHTGHNVLPHTNPESTISRSKIAGTCMKCHANIEAAHVKVIRGELWESESHKIPACVECHSPHKARRVLYEDSLNDKFCLSCHGNSDLTKIMANGDEKSLYTDVNDFEHSIHKKKRIACVKCHVNMDHSNKPVCVSSGPVDCSICHAEQVALYKESTHGQLVDKNDPNAPLCTTCHGRHNVRAKADHDSPIFARNIPDLCATCHQEGKKAALKYKGKQHEIVKHYKMSIHGKGLGQSGLMVSASCTSCHSAHSMLPASDKKSSVNRDNIVATCGECHLGIAEKFATSVHSKSVTKTDKKLPVCNDCHTSHTINRHDTADFRNQILEECGVCHEKQTHTYFDTYHGKASLLSGGEKTAKCSDCHGSHDILPPYNPKSKLSRDNVVETCRACHPDSNRKFTGYLTHATHHDRDKFPYLFYTFWGMTGLLLGTFAFFGIHTLFWIPRSFRERFKRRRQFSREKLFK